jgi:hypothetical protein
MAVLFNGTPDETSNLRRMRTLTTTIYEELGYA